MKTKTKKDNRKTRPYQIEIRDSDDELVTHSPVQVHIERMARNHWWMTLNVGSEAVEVNFHAQGKISATMERYGK